MTPRIDSLHDVRHDLLDLHRALVEAERRTYERERGRLPDRDFLEALINDPALGWLSALTALSRRASASIASRRSVTCSNPPPARPNSTASTPRHCSRAPTSWLPTARRCSPSSARGPDGPERLDRPH